MGLKKLKKKIFSGPKYWECLSWMVCIEMSKNGFDVAHEGGTEFELMGVLFFVYFVWSRKIEQESCFKMKILLKWHKLICCFKMVWINEWPSEEPINRPEFNSREPFCMLVPKGHEFNPQMVQDLEARFQRSAVSILDPKWMSFSRSSSEKLFLAHRCASAELVNYKKKRNKNCVEML